MTKDQRAEALRPYYKVRVAQVAQTATPEAKQAIKEICDEVSPTTMATYGSEFIWKIWQMFYGN